MPYPACLLPPPPVSTPAPRLGPTASERERDRARERVLVPGGRERLSEGEREGAPCLGARSSVSSAVASTLRLVEEARLCASLRRRLFGPCCLVRIRALR